MSLPIDAAAISDAGGGLSLRLSQPGPIPLNVALDCRPGEVVALVGPSGSGKSTTLRSVAGLYTARDGWVRSNGTVWFDAGQRVNLPARRRRVGFVFQSYALFPHMTALENIMLAMDHLPLAARAEQARRLIAVVHLAGLEDRYPAQLSGGQQQRVAVARALARDPEVLLLDEPFSAVDKATRQRLYVELAELRRAVRAPILIVTHDLDEASLLADRLCILHRGEALQTGTPLEIKTRPVNSAVARLVDIRNLFEGRVLDHDPGKQRTYVRWREQTLEVALAERFEPGERVLWCVPTSSILLHSRVRPSRGERENPVSGAVRDMVVLGDGARITMAVEGGDGPPLTLTVPLHVVHRNVLSVGEAITVTLMGDGIHLLKWEEGV
ncbi:MAG: ABC transporter ATP-binding protein [Rhodospirillaceae bacterium]